MSGKHRKRKRSSSSEDRESHRLRKKIKEIEDKLRRLEPKQRVSSSRKKRDSTSRERLNKPGKLEFPPPPPPPKKNRKKSIYIFEVMRLSDGGSLPQGWTNADQNPMTARSYSQDETTAVHDFPFFHCLQIQTSEN